MRWMMTVAALAMLSACVLHPGPRARPAPPPPPPPAPRPAPPVHRAEPVYPGPVAHPRLALDAPGAASVARDYAFRRGLTTEVQNVHREADAWRVKLKVHGDAKGHLKLLVDAFSGRVSVLEDSVRQHDKGRGNGHGNGRDKDRDEHDARLHYQGN